MWLVVGLGNEGKKYENTRHNVGFIVLRELARRHDLTWSSFKSSGGWFSKKVLAQEASGLLMGAKVRMILPCTYMNLSGENVLPVLKYYGMEASQVIVIHDDLDMKAQSVKMRKGGGGDGGHKGIRSLAQCFQSKDFWRIKVGIGKSPGGRDTQSWVLSSFSSEDLKTLRGSVSDEVERRFKDIFKG